MDLFRSPAFATHVEALMQTYHVPCVAIALLQNETVASAAFGLASIDPPKPCTPDTLFEIASSSKSLTAASVALLVHDNVRFPQVQYNATMSSLLPDDFVMSEEGYTAAVTVEDVLSHRTGSASHDLSYRSLRSPHPDNSRSITRNLRNLAVAYPLRSKFLYCNMMYTVASYLVEKMSGMSFSDFLEQHFFRPLNMESTNLQPGRARQKGLGDRIATGYLWDDKTKQYQGLQAVDMPEAQGAGGIMTSVNDYIKYVKAMVHQEGPITNDVYAGLIRPRILSEPDNGHLRPYTSPASYAAGWESRQYRGHLVVSHDGSDPGFHSYHFFVPEYRAGGVLLSNSDNGGLVLNILMRELIDEIENVPNAERTDWKATEAGFPDGNGGGGGGDGDDDDDDKASDKKLLQELCPGLKEKQPQRMPLGAYTGTYLNQGYHDLTVQICDGRLFVNASDRSFPFALTFEHACNQTKYIGHMRAAGPWGNGDMGDIKAEFAVDEQSAVKMGLQLDSDLKALIRFDRV